MKKIKNILSLLFLGLAVSMTMTSCLDDNNDDNKGLTDEQKQNYALLMSGG